MDDKQNEVVYNNAIVMDDVIFQNSLNITDEEMIQMTIPELNRVMRNLDQEEAKKIKQVKLIKYFLNTSGMEISFV